MNMAELEDFSKRIQERLASVQRMLDLSIIDLPQNKMKKLGQVLFAIEGILEESEKYVSRQKDQLQHLKTLEQSSQKYLEDLRHLQDNIPEHLPKKKNQVNEPVKVQTNTEDNQSRQPEKVKKVCKGYIKEMEIITIPEYESIPQYMKGRVTYDQLNAAVLCINASVSSKYKILHQPTKTLNNHSRKLHQRFKEQETKDTKGQFFIVEADIREFSETKVDKKFQGILNMLRHCQRLKELRGGGITRYVLL
ncbi:spindle and kinetochore-associated protein 1 [Periophthalmus magnuspinnatus]|uniref:spindle and kinetochore-associated protein 1 n=1 Tax=Periophthalmus magnuspinnatus TaxID=409849 RepID=UPI002436571B|nr:spindle and kinetochore-associated protein 1 [Periophthalmus magnuspinnatus]